MLLTELMTWQFYIPQFFSESKMQLILELITKTQVSVRQLSAWARRRQADL